MNTWTTYLLLKVLMRPCLQFKCRYSCTQDGELIESVADIDHEIWRGTHLYHIYMPRLSHMHRSMIGHNSWARIFYNVTWIHAFYKPERLDARYLSRVVHKIVRMHAYMHLNSPRLQTKLCGSVGGLSHIFLTLSSFLFSSLAMDRFDQALLFFSLFVHIA